MGQAFTVAKTAVGRINRGEDDINYPLEMLSLVPVVSPILRGVKTVQELSGDMNNPTVSAGETTKHFVQGLAETVVSIAPAGALAVKAVKVAKGVNNGMKAYDGIADAGNFISGGHDTDTISRPPSSNLVGRMKQNLW